MPTTHAGVLVLAERSTAFLQWNAQESRYQIVWRLPYSQLTDYRIESYGRSRRLVVASNDYRTQSFELTGPGVGLIDREKKRRGFSDPEVTSNAPTSITNVAPGKSSLGMCVGRRVQLASGASNLPQTS
jgi:hypothetical protein